MARDTIIRKLDDLTARGISSEAEALYLLAETRKLLELVSEKQNYEMLTFFCDWALHPFMDRKNAQKYLQLFDGFHKALNKFLVPDLEQIFETLDTFLTLEGFKNELGQFFVSQGISDDVLQDGGWPAFLNLYAAVIADCPLKIRADSTTTEYISEVTVTLKEGDEPTDFIVNWGLAFKKEPKYGTVTDFSVPMKNPRKANVVTDTHHTIDVSALAG